MAKKSKRFVVIEMFIPDGWSSMYVGEFVSREDGQITLRNPCYVKDTGRRHLFFAGNADPNAEWEPSGPLATFPAAQTIVTEWPHDFTPFLSAK